MTGNDDIQERPLGSQTINVKAIKEQKHITILYLV